MLAFIKTDESDSGGVTKLQKFIVTMVLSFRAQIFRTSITWLFKAFVSQIEFKNSLKVEVLTLAFGIKHCKKVKCAKDIDRRLRSKFAAPSSGIVIIKVVRN